MFCNNRGRGRKVAKSYRFIYESTEVSISESQSSEQWGVSYSRNVSSACDYSMTRGFLRLMCLHLGPFRLLK